MAEYINRDELKEALLRRGFYPTFVKTALESLPAIDIVRCRDCVHGVKREDLGGRYMCRRAHNYHRPDFYCFYGERRDNDGEIH